MSTLIATVITTPADVITLSGTDPLAEQVRPARTCGKKYFRTPKLQLRKFNSGRQ
jgi:hypothetical protein